MSKTTDEATQKVNMFFSMVEDRFEQNLAKNVKTQTTTLAKEVCGKFDMDWQMAYHMIKLYLSHRPDLYVKNGSKGGVDYIKNK